MGLLTPHRRTLLNYARRALARSSEAEDAVQAAVLRGFRDFDRFAQGSNFRAFIFTYLVHEVLNANKRRHPQALDDEAIEPSTEEPDVIAVLERETAYEAALRAPERILDVVGDPLAQALVSLPNQERSIFLLRSIAELTYAEIAAACEIPLGTVMTRLHRARAKLRRALTEYAVERGLVPRQEQGREEGSA